jgi:rod shape-determining protein MreD
VSPVRAIANALFLFVIFTIQESAVARINFPIAGFSFYLAVLLALMSLEESSGSVLMGFIGGFILDLAPSTGTPFGQWALVLTLVGYVIGTNRESIGDFTSRPGAFVGFVSAASALTLIGYLLLGTLLGENNGSILHNGVIIFGNSLWTLVFAPLVLPLLAKLRSLSLTSRERV